jgi:CheY-like chemotaxis protein
MDIQLDGPRDGIEAARIIRDKFAIPSLFVTGSTDSALRNRAMMTKPLGYLKKPLVVAQLQWALSELAMVSIGRTVGGQSHHGSSLSRVGAPDPVAVPREP